MLSFAAAMGDSVTGLIPDGRAPGPGQLWAVCGPEAPSASPPIHKEGRLLMVSIARYHTEGCNRRAPSPGNK